MGRSFSSWFAWMFTREFMRGRRRKKRISVSAVPRRTNVTLPPETIERLRQIPGVTVLEPSGRRTKPNSLDIRPRDQPAQLCIARAFISADVTIDHATYGFHAFAHPRAFRGEGPWLNYAVTGPGRDTGPGEFHITDQFRWTGDRPWNPMPVKAALREWLKRPEVVQAVAAAKAALPVRPRVRDQHQSDSPFGM